MLSKTIEDLKQRWFEIAPMGQLNPAGVIQLIARESRRRYSC